MNLNGKWMRAAILALIAAAPFAVRAQSASEVGQAQSDTKPVREQWGPVVGQQLPPEGIFNPATGMRFIQLANGWVVEVPPEGRGLMPSTEAPEVTPHVVIASFPSGTESFPRAMRSSISIAMTS